MRLRHAVSITLIGILIASRPEDTMQKRTPLIPLSILAFALAACQGAGSGGGGPVDVGSTGAPPSPATTDVAASPTTTAAGVDPTATPGVSASSDSSADPTSSVGTAEAVADGTYTFQARDVGTVSVTVAGLVLSLDSVTMAEGWQAREYGDADGDDQDVEIDLTNGDAEVDFDAELEDGTLDADVDVEGPAADGSYTFPLGDAGSITIDIAGTQASLAETSLAEAWEVVEQEGEGDVELDIVNAAMSTSIDFEADADDDGLEVDIEFEIGRDFDALRHDDDDDDDGDDSDDRDDDSDGDSGNGDTVDSTEGARIIVIG